MSRTRRATSISIAILKQNFFVSKHARDSKCWRAKGIHKTLECFKLGGNSHEAAIYNIKPSVNVLQQPKDFNVARQSALFLNQS